MHGHPCSRVGGTMENANKNISVTTLGGALWGFLYVLTNPTMPGVVKVGQTERHPQIRATELSTSSGIPTPFIVEFFIEVTDAVKAEQLVHSELSKVRVSSDKEFVKALRIFCIEHEVTMQDFIREAIDEKMSRMKAKK